jgi:hypothetical protein
MIANKHERVSQIYNWFRTARLNVLYYEDSLRKWTLAIQFHDSLIALSGGTSPIAFWQRSADPIYRQFLVLPDPAIWITSSFEAHYPMGEEINTIL